MELLERAWGVFRDHWEVILLVLTWLSIALLAVRRRRDWKRKRFTGQVNFSLNYVDDGTLRLRTLLEEPAERVWLNAHGVKQVQRAAERTTLEQPFLRLRQAKDMEYVNRAIINRLSERFASSFVARSLGMDVVSGAFLFGVTWERYGGIRTQKLRVLVIRRDDLAAMFDPGGTDANPRTESEIHRDRVTTLRRMWQLTRARKERDRRIIGTVELGVVLPRGGDASPVPYLSRREAAPMEPVEPVEPGEPRDDLVPLADEEIVTEGEVGVEVEPRATRPEETA